MSIYKTSHYCKLVQLYLKKKKNDPWFTMGQNIKSYATFLTVHFPREREGGLTAKSLSLSAKI